MCAFSAYDMRFLLETINARQHFAAACPMRLEKARSPRKTRSTRKRRLDPSKPMAACTNLLTAYMQRDRGMPGLSGAKAPSLLFPDKLPCGPLHDESQRYGGHHHQKTAEKLLLSSFLSGAGTRRSCSSGFLKRHTATQEPRRKTRSALKNSLA